MKSSPSDVSNLGVQVGSFSSAGAGVGAARGVVGGLVWGVVVYAGRVAVEEGGGAFESGGVAGDVLGRLDSGEAVSARKLSYSAFVWQARSTHRPTSPMLLNFCARPCRSLTAGAIVDHCAAA